ncbi:MAG TPA: hypothetical protein VGL93_20715 [Streptosporangiaceae bacterium]|jgi:UDP-N-acetylmuramyl pentapeptide phosphotransferase/UDP-N-acetylglucosamine-1-phosphate transferase
MRGRGLLSFALGAVAARAAYAALTRRPPGGAATWTRTNHRGEPLTLLEGPAVAGAASLACAAVLPGRLRAAALLAGAGSGALGAYDDLAGSGDSRGFRGHLGALARGEVTSGAVKILGIGAAGLAAAALARPRPSVVDVVVDGGVIAGSANLLNLFDLRPGRAVKVAALAGAPLAVTRGPGGAAACATLGAAGALLDEDLGERAMLGDAGANALGALLGVAAVTALPRPARVAALAAIAGLTAASEAVSFTKVIEATPPLRKIDMLGRRPVAPRPSEPSTGEAAAAALAP